MRDIIAAIGLAVLLDLVVTGWGLIMAAAPLLQALRIVRRRHSADVSLPMLVILLVGGVMWASFGLRHGVLALTICNIVGIICSSLAILAWLRYRGAPEPGPQT